MYPISVCVKDKVEMKIETTGVTVCFYAGESRHVFPYQIFEGDLWKCPICGDTVIRGFGANPVSDHNSPDFPHWLDNVDYHIYECFEGQIRKE